MNSNHKELKIFFQKRLIFLRFNQKLSFQKREHRFIDISLENLRTVRFAEEVFDAHNPSTSREISGHIPTTWAHTLLNFHHLILIGASLRSHVSHYHLLSVRLNHDFRISLKRSIAINIACALMAIWWIEIHQIKTR